MKAVICTKYGSPDVLSKNPSQRSETRPDRSRMVGWGGRSFDGGGFAEYALARRTMVVPKESALRRNGESE